MVSTKGKTGATKEERDNTPPREPPLSYAEMAGRFLYQLTGYGKPSYERQVAKTQWGEQVVDKYGHALEGNLDLLAAKAIAGQLREVAKNISGRKRGDRDTKARIGYDFLKRLHTVSRIGLQEFIDSYYARISSKPAPGSRAGDWVSLRRDNIDTLPINDLMKGLAPGSDQQPRDEVAKALNMNIGIRRRGNDIDRFTGILADIKRLAEAKILLSSDKVTALEQLRDPLHKSEVERAIALAHGAYRKAGAPVCNIVVPPEKTVETKGQGWLARWKASRARRRSFRSFKRGELTLTHDRVKEELNRLIRSRVKDLLNLKMKPDYPNSHLPKAERRGKRLNNG